MKLTQEIINKAIENSQGLEDKIYQLRPVIEYYCLNKDEAQKLFKHLETESSNLSFQDNEKKFIDNLKHAIILLAGLTTVSFYYVPEPCDNPTTNENPVCIKEDGTIKIRIPIPRERPKIETVNSIDIRVKKEISDGGGIIPDANVTITGNNFKIALSERTNTSGQVSWQEGTIKVNSNNLKIGNRITIEVKRENYEFYSKEFIIDKSDFTIDITLTRKN